ncbi:MAG: YbbR family protein [candidate division TA06 bacterium 32_111]|uniref:YbbR family protein n=2 Tax=Bacteria candidate phyla TaxID=1783234 RepID=A0A101I067_UNCT6|nr:MAG: YbbR family protein [candidate division TA06 bacterium 32_111]KUK86616.1 MAG: YbbR family protein [candidate division TA06 bacterium 34_109]HAF07844.1 hypothetical protein [candidate division WOR-3 bacterium]HCP17362.1 hypothetical protein [candidate division WOR-3 bacterium]
MFNIYNMNKGFFQNNLSLKLVSLLIGILIWFYAFIQEDLTMTIPVKVKILTNEENSSYFIYESSKLDIDFLGKRKDFLLLKFLKKLPVYEIRIEGDTLGEKVEDLTFENVLVPSQVNLKPLKFKGKKFLKFYIDRELTKDVSIIPKFKGVLNQNLSFYKDVEISPKKVSISGPEKLLKNIDYLESEEIELSKLKKSQSLKVKIKRVNEFIEYKDSLINVKFYIEKKVVKVFKGVPVLFINRKPNLRFSPDSLTAILEIEGPESIVKNMLPGELTLTVDLSGIEKKGEYLLRINQPIKEFVRIKNMNPSEVKVLAQ